MIQVIQDKSIIRKLHQRFNKQLNPYLTQTISCWVGYPSGSYQDDVRYSKRLDFWLSHFEHKNRFWNGFGLGKPISGGMNSLNGEINFPYQGINRRVSGVFAKDDENNFLVLHRGRIGGGKPGVGKSVFVDNFRGDFVTAIDGDRESKFCLVGELGSNLLPKQVANFINEIYRIKSLIKSGDTNKFAELSSFNFTEEQSGQSSYDRDTTTIINRTHGIVVNELANQLESRRFKVGNDKNRDLFIYDKKQITNLFEIKTNTATQSIYSAVGQLIIYSIPIKNEVSLFIVLPDKLTKTVEKRLHSLGILPLYYHWANDTPIFPELDNILTR